MIFALTLAKNGVPVRVLEKDSEYHKGQRGSGLQPRTLELYNYLGVLSDITSKGSLMVPRCVYEMPEGRKPIKIFNMSEYEEPTPSVPFVSIRVLVHCTSFDPCSLLFRGTRGYSARAAKRKSYALISQRRECHTNSTRNSSPSSRPQTA